MANHFVVFIKSLILTQLFIFCLIAGVSIDINSYYLSHNPLKQTASLAKPLSNINIDEKICQQLFKNTSFLLAGNADNTNAREYVYRQLPHQFLTAHIPALSYSNEKYILVDNSINEDDKMLTIADIQQRKPIPGQSIMKN